MKTLLSYTTIAIAFVVSTSCSNKKEQQTQQYPIVEPGISVNQSIDTTAQVDTSSVVVDTTTTYSTTITQSDTTIAESYSQVEPSTSREELPTTYTSQNDDVAVVVFQKSDCDYVILENRKGYIVAEWMRGGYLYEGYKLTGEFNHYGSREVFNIRNERTTKLYIEDYMLGQDEALKLIGEKCQ